MSVPVSDSNLVDAVVLVESSAILKYVFSHILEDFLIPICKKLCHHHQTGVNSTISSLWNGSLVAVMEYGFSGNPFPTKPKLVQEPTSSYDAVMSCFSNKLTFSSLPPTCGVFLGKALTDATDLFSQFSTYRQSSHSAECKKVLILICACEPSTSSYHDDLTIDSFQMARTLSEKNILFSIISPTYADEWKKLFTDAGGLISPGYLESLHRDGEYLALLNGFANPVLEAQHAQASTAGKPSETNARETALPTNVARSTYIRSFSSTVTTSTAAGSIQSQTSTAIPSSASTTASATAPSSINAPSSDQQTIDITSPPSAATSSSSTALSSDSSTMIRPANQMPTNPPVAAPSRPSMPTRPPAPPQSVGAQSKPSESVSQPVWSGSLVWKMPIDGRSAETLEAQCSISQHLPSNQAPHTVDGSLWPNRLQMAFIPTTVVKRVNNFLANCTQFSVLLQSPQPDIIQALIKYFQKDMWGYVQMTLRSGEPLLFLLKYNHVHASSGFFGLLPNDNRAFFTAFRDLIHQIQASRTTEAASAQQAASMPQAQQLIQQKPQGRAMQINPGIRYQSPQSQTALMQHQQQYPRAEMVHLQQKPLPTQQQPQQQKPGQPQVVQVLSGGGFGQSQILQTMDQGPHTQQHLQMQQQPRMSIPIRSQTQAPPPQQQILYRQQQPNPGNIIGGPPQQQFHSQQQPSSNYIIQPFPGPDQM